MHTIIIFTLSNFRYSVLNSILAVKKHFNIEMADFALLSNILPERS